jgi:putative transposase
LGCERVKIFAIDETGVIVAGSQAFLFIAYEPFEKRILGLHLAWTPSSLSVELFLKDLVRKYGRHPVWTDAGDWYPPACELMNLKASRLPARLVALGGHGERELSRC